ncbi:unnamed protein product, partial [Choristocarpus tenellus]
MVLEVVPGMQPLATTDPKDAFCPHMDRPEETWPTKAWGNLFEESSDLHTSLPTNAWWENIVLGDPTQERPENFLAVLPYTFDVAGESTGLRIHSPQIYASDLIVMTRFDWRHAFHLGCVEDVGSHTVSDPGPLSVTIDCVSSSSSIEIKAPGMSVPAVRGSPYATMEYRGVRPFISARQEATSILVDGTAIEHCGNGTHVQIERELEITFSGSVSSDDTWLVFLSQPMTFLCSSYFQMERGEPPTPGALGAWQRMPRFELTAVAPLESGVIRAALANNCSTGTSPTGCENWGKPNDRAKYTSLLRDHAEVYPTGAARVSYSSSSLNWIEKALRGDGAQAISASPPVSSSSYESQILTESDTSSTQEKTQEKGEDATEKGTLTFQWGPRKMDGTPFIPSVENAPGGKAMLHFALPHHELSLLTDSVTGVEMPTLHGQARLVIANFWEMELELFPVSFGVERPVREEMRDAVNSALDADLGFEIPENYLRGEGDSEF